MSEREAVDVEEPDLTEKEVVTGEYASQRLFPPPPDDQRCTATSLSTGERCRNWLKPPSTVCRYHGALSLKGPAVATFEHGRYSKMLPKRLRSGFIAALRDQNLDNLRKQIALCEAREIELITRLNGHESGFLWDRVGDTYDKLEAAFVNGDTTQISKMVKELRDLIMEGTGDKRQWEEIHTNMEMRRRLVETERKRIEFLQANVTPEMMAAFVGRVTMIVAGEVKDRNVLSRIADGIRAAAFGEKYLDAELVSEALEAEFEVIEPPQPTDPPAPDPPPIEI